MRLYPQLLLPASSQSAFSSTLANTTAKKWTFPDNICCPPVVPQVTYLVLEFHLIKVHMVHFVIVFFKSLGMLKSLPSAHLVF